MRVGEKECCVKDKKRRDLVRIPCFWTAQKKSPEVLAVVAVALRAVGAVGAVGTARVVVAVDALLIQVATVDKVSGQGAFPAAPPAAAGSRGDWLLWP